MLKFTMQLFNNTGSFRNIKKCLEENNLNHAYLFLSPDTLTNFIFIKEIAGLLLCDNKNNCGSCPSCLKISAESHPDLLSYPKNKNFVVEDANDIATHSLEKPMISKRKLIIIHNIDNATIQSQNKILKTLEEPPKSVIFLLTAINENKILPTIISRTLKTSIPPLSKNLIKDYLISNKNTDQNQKLLEEALEYGEGWIGKTWNIIENDSFTLQIELVKKIVNSFNSSKNISFFSSEILKYKSDIEYFLELLLKEFGKLLQSKNAEGAIMIIRQINLANQNINRNVNINLIIDNLLMKILEIKYLHQMQ